MAKVIESPVKRFSGTVVLPDYLTFPQYEIFNECRLEAKKAKEESKDQRKAVLPGILACVSEWHLANLAPEQLTAETFPATPAVAVSQLIGWLVVELTRMIFEVDESPNA